MEGTRTKAHGERRVKPKNATNCLAAVGAALALGASPPLVADGSHSDTRCERASEGYMSSTSTYGDGDWRVCLGLDFVWAYNQARCMSLANRKG